MMFNVHNKLINTNKIKTKTDIYFIRKFFAHTRSQEMFALCISRLSFWLPVKIIIKLSKVCGSVLKEGYRRWTVLLDISTSKAQKRSLCADKRSRIVEKKVVIDWEMIVIIKLFYVSIVSSVVSHMYSGPG